MDNIKRQAGYTGGTTADVLAAIKAGQENTRLTPGQRKRKRLKRGGTRRAQAWTPPPLPPPKPGSQSPEQRRQVEVFGQRWEIP